MQLQLMHLLFAAMKLAHTKDVTLNQLFEEVLTDKLEELKDGL